MFSYYPRSSYWQDEFNHVPSRARYTRAPESRPPPQRPATSMQRPARDSHTIKTAVSNPTVFKTYNPEARADFTSKEMITLVGPEPRYIDGYAIYSLDNVIEPRVRVLKGTDVQAFSAGKIVLKFRLPRNISAVDIDASFTEDKLTVKVPHCLSETQECQVIEVSDGLLGDEYDEHGHYESLRAELNRKERLERQKQQEEEERMQYKALLERQMERKRREAEERAHAQSRYRKHESFEPTGYFPSFFNQPNFSRLFFM